MPLTVEDVNAIQDEMNKIGNDGKSAEELAAEAAAAEAKAKEDAAKSEEAKAVAEKAKADEDAAKKAAEEKAKADEAAKGKADEEEVDDTRDIRQQLRESNAALKMLMGQYQKLNKVLEEKGLITEEEVKANKEAEEAASKLLQERTIKLNEMVAIMEVNPSYTDVRDVCSQANLDDLIEAFARHYVKEEGGDYNETVRKMEAEIWSEANPYKKIYELVKKFHPKYAKPEEKKVDDKAVKKDEKKVVEVTPSAANIGAGGGGGGEGWTAAKIDALPEDELHTVPKDIYEKYLLGTLK